MNFNKFKMFLEKRITIIEKEINQIELKIKSLPKSENIKLSTYGNIKKLRSMYPEHKKNLIKKIFGPTKKDIQKEIYTQELAKLKEKLILEQEKKSELEKTISAIAEDKIIQELEINKETIKSIIAFANEEQLKNQKTIEMIVYILKNSRTDIEQLENKITQNIASFFNDDLTLKEESKLETLELLFDKLFLVIFDQKEYKTQALTINSIITEIKLLQKSTPVEKADLETQKTSIQELKKYVKENEIIKIYPNIQEFESLLINSGLQKEQISHLKAIMEEKIKEEKEEKTIIEIKKLMNTLLSETELKYIKLTEDFLKTNEASEEKILLQRVYEDIISLFKYLNLTGLTNEYEDTNEIITQKINELKVIINNTKYSSETENYFYYITDKNNIPLILKNIEMLDIVEHQAINKLLHTLAKKEQEHFMFQKGGLDFYEISNASLSLLYVKYQNEIIILCLERKTRYENIKNRVNQTLINEIKGIINTPKTKKYKQLHKMYENLIIQALDLNHTKENIYIHQKKKD